MIVNPKRKKLKGLVSFKMKGKIGFLGNLERRDATKHDIEKDFPRELIEIWVDFNFRDFFLSKPDFCSSSSSSMIWNNALVRIGFFFFFFFFFFYKHWVDAGVHDIKDLVNDDFKVSLPLSMNLIK